jgi:hypothetical protein
MSTSKEKLLIGPNKLDPWTINAILVMVEDNDPNEQFKCGEYCPMEANQIK